MYIPCWQGVALDLVDHETLDKLVEIIRDKDHLKYSVFYVIGIVL